MTQQDIEIFFAVLEKRNLSKAASALFMSQSTLSHRLGVLEKELNAQLFTRHKGHRTLELTPYGHDFVRIAEQWMALWAEAQALHTVHGSRTFYIGSVASLIQHLFPELVRDLFKKERDRVHLMIKTMQSAALYPALENREIDLGFSVLPSIYSNVINNPLLNEENVLLLHSENPLPAGSFGPDIHPNELDPSKEILFQYHRDYMHWRNYWFGYFTDPAVGLGDALLVENFFSVPGDEWCVAPMSLAMAVQRRGRVNVHRLINPPPPRTCYMLTHRIPRAGYEDCMDMFMGYMSSFLKKQEERGLLEILK